MQTTNDSADTITLRVMGSISKKNQNPSTELIIFHSKNISDQK